MLLLGARFLAVVPAGFLAEGEGLLGGLVSAVDLCVKRFWKASVEVESPLGSMWS